MMVELPLVLLGGLLGSAHCVGMCGGFALTIGSGAGGMGRQVARQLVYSLGRIFTYAALGGALGYAGLRLADSMPAVVRVQGSLAIVAGALLIVLGLGAAGIVPRRFPWTPPSKARVAHASSIGPACLATGMLGTFLRAPGWGSIFLAGVITGLLPCGLVYSFLALACSTASLPVGAATMAVFGLGTVPLMVLTGSGASLLTLVTRQRMLRFAAWCVVFTGLVSLARGTMALAADGSSQAPACPACAKL